MKKTLLSIALVIALSVTLFAGCSGKDSVTSQNNSKVSTGDSSKDSGPVTPAGQLPITKEKVTITAFAEVDPKMDLENNEIIKKMEQETNVKLKITARPSNLSDVKTMRNLMLASNDYPDMFMPFNNSYFTMAEILKYGVQDKTFIPLNNLLDKYGYELKRIFKEAPDLKKIMTAPDGNIYAFSKMTQCGHCRAYTKMWVNYKWLEKLGIKEPQTTDEFYQMLKAFKEKDPNGNGQADEMALTAEAGNPIDTWIVNSFLPYSPKVGNLSGANYSYIDNNDKVVFSADKPEFKEALKYMKKLYSEGLVDIAAYSQKGDQMKQTIMKTPYKVGAFVAVILGNGIDINNKEAMGTYHALPPVAGPKGVRYQCSANGPSNLSGYANSSGFFAISDKCKNPEAAFRLMDYMLNEDVTFSRQYGIKGTDWEPAAPGTKNIAGGEYKYKRITYDPNSERGKSYINRMLNIGPTGNLFKFRDTWSADISGDALNEPANYEARLEKETQPLVKYFYPKELPSMMFMGSVDETQEFNELANNLNSHVVKNCAQFVIGSRDIDAEWDSYVNELKKFKVDRFIELYQKAYDNFKKVK